MLWGNGGYSGNTGGTTVQVPQNDSSGSGDWTDWIRAGLAVKSAFQKPTFTQAQMSPEMKKIYDIYIASLMDPAYKDLGHDVTTRAKQQVDKLGAGSWTSPKTFSGDVGYSGNADVSGRTPWSSAATNKTYPGQNILNNSPSLDGPSVRNPETGRTTPNIQQWEPASEFPTSPRMPQTDPNKEVSRDPNHPLANINPTGSTGSSIPGGSNTNTLPSGMSRTDVGSFASFLRSQGVKDAGKIAVGFFSGGLTGAALAAAKVGWDHYQATKKGGG